jgi:hypothetical protein
MLDGRENAPARSRLTGRFGEFVTGRLQHAVESEDVHDELTDRIACGRAPRRRVFLIDSMLSLC